MAITFLQEKKKQRYLVLILALVICAILLIVWLGFLREAEPTSLPVLPDLAPPQVEIDWATLQDPRLTELQAFEQILPLEEEIGRENPFLPY